MSCNCNDPANPTPQQCCCDPQCTGPHCDSISELEQLVNDAVAAEKTELELAAKSAALSADDAAKSAGEAAASAHDAKGFRDSAENAASSATASLKIITDTAIILEDSSKVVKSAADEVLTAIAGISVRNWYYTTTQDGETTISVPNNMNALAVQNLYIHGVRQDLNYGFTFDKPTMLITLAQPLPKGTRVTVVLGVYNTDPANNFAQTLADSNGASLVGTSSGRNVQQEIDDLKLNSGDLRDALIPAMTRILAEADFTLQGTFEDGTTLTKANDVILFMAQGKAYKWTGTLPKTVAANSTPGTTGTNWVDVTQVTLHSLLQGDQGTGVIGYKVPFTDAVKRSLFERMQDYISVRDFGAVGDGVADDSAAFQAAVDAAGWGGKVYIPKPAKDYLLKAPVLLKTPITLQGYGGSTVSRKDMPRILVQGNINAFVLVPTLDGFRFEYGVSGVNICDLMIEGPGINTRGSCGITVDTTVNNGVYHVRECCFERNHIRYMDFGFKINGVCYLNEWYSNRTLWCGTGCEVDKVDGATEGASDQSRFFGNEFVLNNVGLTLSAKGNMGSQTIIGNTISEGNAGLIIGSHTQACIMGNQIENNKWYGIGMNIPAGANPACESSKVIMGNCFLFNEVDIDVAKTSTLLTGGFPYSLRIASNNFQQTKSRVLRVTAPSGAQEFDSRMFIFEMDNVYSDGQNSVGTVPPSMIEALWAGFRGYMETGKVTMTAVVADDWHNIGTIKVPYGKQCHITYRMVSFPTKNTAADALTNAGLRIYKLNDGSKLKDDFGRGGTMFFSRADVSTGLELLIAGGPNGAGNSAYIEVQYCII